MVCGVLEQEVPERQQVVYSTINVHFRSEIAADATSSAAYIH